MSRKWSFAAAGAAAVLLAACGASDPSKSAGASSAGAAQNDAAQKGAMGGTYVQHDLVSDGAVAADHIDPNLVNAWGIAHLPTSPWWVSDNGTGVATLYDQDGVAQFPGATLVVNVTGAGGGPAANDGVVANTGAGFVVSSGGASGPARFIFASEDGTISGWNPGVPAPVAPATRSTVTEVVVDHSSSDPLGGSVYKGIAIASTEMGDRLLATDFRNGKVDVFDDTFKQLMMPGAFVDPGIPAGFAPFGIQVVNGTVLVTYAKQDAARHDDVAGRHLGFVNAFSPDGKLLRRVVSAGKLNSPWGLAMAPETGFGRASGKLLVGNFGDGHIIAYDLEHANEGEMDVEGEAGGGMYLTSAGGPIVIDGLWGIGFGAGNVASGPVNTLFFAAGPNGEADGLFGRIDYVPPPGQAK